MKTGLLLAALSACLVLAGCGDSAHTVDWYKQHGKAAAKKATWCKQDAARKVTGDCQNAIEAVAGNIAFGNGKWESIDLTPDKKKPKQKN